MEKNEIGRAEDCLAGGGEMGALMRSTNWSKTPLGPVASWPQSLRTSVSIMLASGFAIVVAWGPEFIFLYNDRYRPVLGTKKHPRALGTAAAQIFPEVWDFIGPLFEKTRAGETVAVDDLLIPLDRFGYLEECFFTLSYSPIRDESGGVGGMLAIVAETTERVQGDRRMRTLRDLAAIAPRAQTADEACENAARSLGQNPTDVPFALVYLQDDDGARLVSRTGIDDARREWSLAEAARAGRPVVVRELELPGGAYPEPTRAAIVLPLTRPGSEHPYGFLVAGICPRRELDDEYQGFFELAAEHVATAITNALSHEAERKRAEALAEIDRAKTTFFGNVSHEFRTPLTLMLAPIEELLARPDPPPEAALIHRNALRLLKLVNTLLDFSRIEAGRAQAAYEPTDLAALTRDIASSFRAATDRAGLALSIECDALGEPVFVDRDMWEKIVLNLLSNAFKFTFEGSIRVRLRAARERVELDVVDTGTGVAEAELPRLFERFHRIEGARSRSFEGSGIGLALVSELVRMHGGAVRVTSRVGRGTTFTIELPRGSAHLPADRVRGERSLESTALGAAPFVEEALRWLPEADTSPATFGAAAKVPRALPSGPRASVVVVDDNADMRAYLARVLAACGDVRTFADGEEALAAIVDAAPDVVVTDVMMPKLDGYGLLRALRADARTRTIPVVLLSARAGEEARIEGAASGADDYVVKPFSARELVARVSAQIELARVRGLVTAERDVLQQFLLNAPAAFAVVRGPAHVYELVNPHYAHLVGRDADALLGRSVRDALPELGTQGVWDLLDRVRATGERYVAVEFPMEIGCPGEGRPALGYFNWVAEPLAGEDGTAERILIFAVEITDQVVARGKAERLAAELEQANRAKDEFLAMLGHELRNPLAPIATAAKLLEQRRDPTLVRELGVIRRQVEHLERLVDDLLDIARITRGKVDLRRERVDLGDIVQKAIEITSPLFDRNRHRLEAAVAAGLEVEADAARLVQVVSNLLTNAAKYTPPGGRITVSAAREGDGVVLRVRDDGVGISPELLPRVFELFAQGEQSIERASGGLGLGLAIVRSLVHLHGGEVSARSEGAGRGSEFQVRLPALAALPRASAPPPAPKTPDGGAMRVLIVDDNADAAEMLSLFLGGLGYDARVAPDGPSALEIAPAFAPEVVLLDLGLPVMDGFEVARRLRGMRETRRSFIAAVTGYGQAEDRARTAAAGFDAHLTKPLDLDALPKQLAARRAPAS